MTFPILLLAAYLLGSIPTGKIVVKRLKGVDIQEYGSGNIGAANVFRVAGHEASALVLLVDILKGALPVLLAKRMLDSPTEQALVGLAAVCGHVWPVFHQFKGGKGVLTNLGTLTALAPEAGALSALVGGAVIAKTRYSSLGSMTGTLAGAALLAYLVVSDKKPPGYLLQALLPTALILATHRENIQRLLSGKENKLAVGATKRGNGDRH